MAKRHDIIWLETVDSTNEEAKRHISTLDNLSVLSVSYQTQGKGQRSNRWLSEPGCNLLISIVMKPSEIWGKGCLEAKDQFTVSRITAESVVELLGCHDIEARIKLPNDIYVGDNKICGILIENGIKGNLLEYSIIGIGLNVNQTTFDAALPNPVSMSSITGRTYDLSCLLDRFMDIFIDKAVISLS